MLGCGIQMTKARDKAKDMWRPRIRGDEANRYPLLEDLECDSRRVDNPLVFALRYGKGSVVTLRAIDHRPHQPIVKTRGFKSEVQHPLPMRGEWQY